MLYSMIFVNAGIFSVFLVTIYVCWNWKLIYLQNSYCQNSLPIELFIKFSLIPLAARYYPTGLNLKYGQSKGLWKSTLIYQIKLPADKTRSK